MRLRALAAALEERFGSIAHQVLSSLEVTGIKTALDLIYEPQPRDLFVRAIPEGLFEFQDFLALIEHVALLSSASGVSGDQAYDEQQELLDATSGGETGLKELDDLVGGGFGHYGILELSGSVGSLVASHILLRHLVHLRESSILWLDTTGDFSVDHAAVILGHLMPGTDPSIVLERFQVSLCFNLQAVNDAIDALGATLDTQIQRPKPAKVRFLVIDSLNNLFTTLLRGSFGSSEGHAIMTNFVRSLSALAHKHCLTVLVINKAVACQPYNPYSAFATSTSKPGLGSTFTYLTDLTMWFAYADELTREDDPALDNIQEQQANADESVRVIVAEVFRSRFTISQRWAAFIVRNSVVLESFPQ